LTDLLSLRRDMLKLGIEKQSHGPGVSAEGAHKITPPAATAGSAGETSAGWERADHDSLVEHSRLAQAEVGGISRRSSFGLKAALLVFVVAIGGAYIGAWLQSRITKQNPEVWSVKASGNQIRINRADQGGRGSVTLNLAAPLRSEGEQTFSSFADVKNYVDTIAGPQLRQEQQGLVQETRMDGTQQPATVSKVVAAPDNPLKQPAHADKTTSKSPKQDDKTGKQTEIRKPEKPAVAATGSTVSALQRTRRVLANAVAPTSEARIVAGDTLEKLARRYKTTSEELRKLNPQINERGVIQPNQKIKVPVSPPPNDPKGRRLALVSKRTNVR
jgi:LysM repeat protein